MRFFTPLLVLLCTGCASIDFDYPRTPSTAAEDTDNTYLGSRVSALSAVHPPGLSGFYPLRDGIDALSARLLLAERAERTIDTQYYLVKTDTTSLAFIEALLRAADRGVRVRLLLDDVFTKGYDAGMAGLDSHPNFEVRVFNPFHRGPTGKVRSGLTDLARVNRRMHTKTFTVDNQVTIVGGRNIADEYFGAREDAKFGDLDVVGMGAIANDVSNMFDSFWNHETALPLPAFARMPEDPAAELEKLRRQLAASRARIGQTRYAEAVLATALEFMDKDGDVLEWAPYQLVYDSPDKGIKSNDGPSVAITTELRKALQSAKSEVIIVSPYFVPRKAGIEFLSALSARGISVTIVTNSLAANNQITVHGGYAPSRIPLLRQGVRIYEVRPDADIAGSEIVAAGGAKATLHTKSFLVDRTQVFVGSFNFDPRSANLNTESGVIIESSILGNEFAETFNARIRSQTYELFLNDDGKLRWRGLEDGEEVIYKKEPRSTWRQRFIAGLVKLLPVKSQL
ncbi:MAG: phospholipase D family protein [Chromatiales bacterium]|nr:MAG: phospholipase D family protein [Chromatiales bacterium]